MVGVIDLQPKVVNLILYAGDGATIRLLCTDKVGAPVDITGNVEAQIRVNRDEGTPPVVQFTVDLTDAYIGVAVLSLTGDQTQTLVEDPSSVKNKFTGVWDIEWTPSGMEPRTLCQGRVECAADVTR